jgi:hypothetical protein
MPLAKIQVVLAMLAAVAIPCASSNSAEDAISAAAVARKTYSNDRFGFAFEYPASWSLVESRGAQSSDALLSLKFLSREENVPVLRDYSPGSVSIEVFANPGRQPLRDWLDVHGWPFDAAGRSVTSTFIGGLPAMEVATGKMFAPNRFTYVATKDWVVRLSALAPDSHVVVQSFRFNP